MATMKMSPFLSLPPHLPIPLRMLLIATLYLRWLMLQILSLSAPLDSIFVSAWRLNLALFCLYNHPLIKSTAEIRSALTALIAAEETFPLSGISSEGGGEKEKTKRKLKRRISAHYSAEDWQDDDPAVTQADIERCICKHMHMYKHTCSGRHWTTTLQFWFSLSAFISIISRSQQADAFSQEPKKKTAYMAPNCRQSLPRADSSAFKFY